MSRTTAYRLLYAATEPLLPMFRRVLPNQTLTTEQFGRAMLKVALVPSGTPIMMSAGQATVSIQ